MAIGRFAPFGVNKKRLPETVADQETLFLLKRFSRNPGIEKARAEFDRAQKVEESFHKDFDGLDFTGNRLPTCDRSCLAALRKAPNSP
jgi:hypothetical protein